MAVKKTGNTVELHKEKKPESDASRFSVYIGPTIMGVIQSGTVYPYPKDKTLRSLASTINKYPLIAALIVSGETLSADRIKVKTAGNLLHVYYKQLASGKKE